MMLGGSLPGELQGPKGLQGLQGQKAGCTSLSSWQSLQSFGSLFFLLPPRHPHPPRRRLRESHEANVHRLVADPGDDEPAVEDLAFLPVEDPPAVREDGDLSLRGTEAAQVAEGEIVRVGERRLRRP